jgi:hypothetical protein
MRFRRAAVMRGYDTDMGALGAGPLTLTVHDSPGAGRAPVPDEDLPHFDVGEDGISQPQAS